MARSITSNRAKVNVQKTQDVLNKYELDGIEVWIDDQGYLRAAAESVGERPWPKAVPVTDFPDADDYATEDEYWDDFFEALEEKGDEGFKCLLRELSFCIETPFVILAISVCEDGGDSDARVWKIDPGSADVEELFVYQERWYKGEDEDEESEDGRPPQLVVGAEN